MYHHHGDESAGAHPSRFCLDGDFGFRSQQWVYGALLTSRFEGTRLQRLLKKSEKQIPRGLKPTRNDKNKGLVTAHLKVCPFKTRSNRLFQQSVQPRRPGSTLKPGFRVCVRTRRGTCFPQGK